MIEGREHPLIDVRRERQFLAGHVPGAVGIPLEELGRRVHELPPRESPLRVGDTDPARAAAAAEVLRTRGHLVTLEFLVPPKLLETGPSRTRLWRPNAFLVEALSRINAEATRAAPTPPRALDIACGSGRDAVYLAIKGYRVQAIDVLPDALERATDLARRCGATIETVCRDLERDPSLSRSAFDLITVFRFLHRPLFAGIREAIASGGYIVYETFHEATGSTGRRPTSPDHLLRTGELCEVFADFQVLVAREAVECDGRFVSSLLARRSFTPNDSPRSHGRSQSTIDYPR